MVLGSRILLWASFLTGLAIAIALLACGGEDDSSPPPVVPSQPGPSSGVFPLRVEPGKRHLVDASGRPFLLHADTAWSLIADLPIGEAETYLEDRRQKGFNAVIVNLLERKFARNAPSNFYGASPFSTPGDFSTPNEAYFTHADQVLRTAAEKGILVLLTPAYIGAEGTDEGWLQEMLASGEGSMTAYGRYLGKRYSLYTNILWVNAGDHDPPTNGRELVRRIALGIKDFDVTSLHTAHTNPESSPTTIWAGESWLSVNNVYTYVDVPSMARSAHAIGMPFLLFESRYENERTPAEGTEQRVRVQAYQALLSGAMGQAFGNNPIWHFGGQGIFNVSPSDWQQWLNSPGANSMVHLRTLFAAREWWKLVPDATNTFLTGGYAGSEPYELAVAARASDGSFALVYIPSAREVTVDLAQLSGTHVVARWYDPASGQFLPVPGSPFARASQVLPTPTGGNASTTGAFSDWVLVLESAS
jgi:hypothetical protein